LKFNVEDDPANPPEKSRVDPSAQSRADMSVRIEKRRRRKRLVEGEAIFLGEEIIASKGSFFKRMRYHAHGFYIGRERWISHILERMDC
jgi:hypothetical protein